MSDPLSSYVIRGLDHGRVVDVSTPGTAKLAIINFLDAVPQYSHVWVCDETGNELSFDDLVLHAAEETSHKRR